MRRLQLRLKSAAFILVIGIFLAGCARPTEIQIGVNEYLAPLQSRVAVGLDYDVLLYPVGVRHDNRGYLIVDVVAEGPAVEAGELAEIVQSDLRHWPMQWIRIEDNSGQVLKLKAPSHPKGAFVQYRGVRGFELALPDDRARVLAQRGLGMWNPLWNNPKSYHVSLIANDAQQRWASRHQLEFHVDTTVHEFEINYVTVIPNAVLPHGFASQATE